MDDLLPIILTGLLSGGVFVAIVEGIREYLTWRRNRKAKQEDRELEKGDVTKQLQTTVKKLEAEEKRIAEEDKKHFDSIENDIRALKDGVKFILLDRILYLGERYIERGEITIEEKMLLHKMHKVYHNRLNGNGDADVIMEAVDELPLKQ